MKWWYPYTKKLKYLSSEIFDEQRNKGSSGSELITGTNVSTLPTLKIYLSYHPLIKDDIFEVNVKFPPRGNTIVIIEKYCENKNMSYIFRSTNNTLGTVI